MIIAIPSSANNIDSLIDERFARCQFFCFYNKKQKNTILKKTTTETDQEVLAQRW